MKSGFFRRYLTVVGLILVVLVAGGIWLKPSPDTLRENVEMGLTQYAATRTSAGEAVPALTHQESKDWLIAVSHSATVGDETFFCVGGFKVTYCDIPE